MLFSRAPEASERGQARIGVART